jgi:hypothetical protein
MKLRTIIKIIELKSGKRMSAVVKGGIIYLMPEKPLEFFKGFLKGMDAKQIREHKER